MRPNVKRALFIAWRILLLPVALLEYFATLWFWWGDGRFTLLAMPIFAAFFLAVQWLLYRKYRNNHLIRNVLVYSMIFITPLLAVGSTELLAALCGISITIA